MNLRQFEALRLVLARGTTKHAAEALGVTQSAVSRQITQLESTLGFSLFERRNGRLHITPEGQHFYKAVERVLNGFDQIKSMARDNSSLRSGTLRLVAMPALAFGLLPGAVKQIRNAFRQAKIAIDIGVRQTAEDGIVSGKYDLGLVTLPIEHEAIIVEPIFGMDCVCVLPKDHRLADRAIIEATDLDGEEYVSIEPDTMLRYRTDELFGREGVRRKLSIEAQSSITICNLVANGLGVSLVHRFVAEVFADRLLVKPFKPAFRFEYGLIRSSGVALSPIAAEFIQTMRDSIRRTDGATLAGIEDVPRSRGRRE